MCKATLKPTMVCGNPLSMIKIHWTREKYTGTHHLFISTILDIYFSIFLGPWKKINVPQINANHPQFMYMMVYVFFFVCHFDNLLFIIMICNVTTCGFISIIYHVGPLFGCFLFFFERPGLGSGVHHCLSPEDIFWRLHLKTGYLGLRARVWKWIIYIYIPDISLIYPWYIPDIFPDMNYHHLLIWDFFWARYGFFDPFFYVGCTSMILHVFSNWAFDGTWTIRRSFAWRHKKHWKLLLNFKSPGQFRRKKAPYFKPST